MVSKLIFFVSLICVSVCIKEPFQHVPDGCVIQTSQGVIDLTPLGSKYYEPTGLFHLVHPNEYRFGKSVLEIEQGLVYSTVTVLRKCLSLHTALRCPSSLDQSAAEKWDAELNFIFNRFKDVLDSITNQYTYSWNPCFGFNEGHCVNVSICQKVLADESYEILGYPEQVSFEEEEGYTGALIYQTTDQMGQQRVSKILLTCEPVLDGVFEIYTEDPILNYKFELKSKYACPVTITPPPPPTAGSVTATVPTPHPQPGIFSIKTITILLFSIQCSLVVIVILLIVAVVGQITRRHSSSTTRVPEKSSFAYKQMD